MLLLDGGESAKSKKAEEAEEAEEAGRKQEQRAHSAKKVCSAKGSWIISSATSV
jgi:hypothetical protein